VEADRYGLPLSTASREAAAAYREGIDLLLSGYPGAEVKLQEALRHDEGFALAYAGLARHQQYYGRVSEVRTSCARAQTLASGISNREKTHIEILGRLLDGQPRKALEALLEHLEAFPRDALPLSLALGAFGLYGFSGRADCDAARLALCRKMAPYYGEDWWFLTHLGWSHTEAGELDAGLRSPARIAAGPRAAARLRRFQGVFRKELPGRGCAARARHRRLRAYGRQRRAARGAARDAQSGTASPQMRNGI